MIFTYVLVVVISMTPFTMQVVDVFDTAAECQKQEKKLQAKTELPVLCFAKKKGPLEGSH